MPVNWNAQDFGIGQSRTPLNMQPGIQNYFTARQNKRQQALFDLDKTSAERKIAREQKLQQIKMQSMGDPKAYALALQQAGEYDELTKFQKQMQDRQKAQVEGQRAEAEEKRKVWEFEQNKKIAHSKTYANLKTPELQNDYYQKNMAQEGLDGQPIPLTPQIHDQIIASTVKPPTRKEKFDEAKLIREQKNDATFRQFLPNIDVAKLTTDENARNVMVKQILSRPDGQSPLAKATIKALKGKGSNFAEEMAKAIAMRDLKGENRPVPASQAVDIGGTAQAIANLDEMKIIIPGLASGFWAPIKDPIRSINPWDVDAQAMKQYIATTKQVIGKGLEGGVLRKEDEHKYSKIIPKVGDTPESMKKKATQLRKMIVDKRRFMLQGLGSAGFNVTGFESIETQLPKIGKYEVVEE